MSTQTTSTTTNNKRTLEERAGLDQLVKGMNDTGITRVPTPAADAVQLSTKDFMKRNLYGYGSHGMDNVHSIFAAGLERRRREAYCLGYGEKGNDTEAEPPVKRRRFQRRNSKTPAMLFNAMKILPGDLFTDDKIDVPKPTVNSLATTTKPQDDDDDADWDGGLEIAEQLVKQLQKRRTSDASVTAH